MKRITLLLALLGIIMMQVAFAQKKQVSGIVSDSDGAPIPGASVLVKGTTQGTITDFDGKYTISVTDDAAVLIFSFVGMEKKEVAVAGKTTVNVVLSTADVGLNEVVVTAMGIERSRKSIGYAVSEVKAEETVQKSEPDVLKTLQGKMAGVSVSGSGGTPGAATRITIRGNSSFRRNNQPLFVVDGIPYSNEQYNTTSQLTTGGAYASGISTLDPNSIKSIQVLKGTAAAALYGSRAANGVILITTKSGSTRPSRKGLEVTYTGSYSLEEVSSLPDYQNKYGAGHNHTFANDNGSWGPKFEDLDEIPMWPNHLAAYPDLPKTTKYKAYPNNVKDLFETGSVMEHSLTVSGGNQNSSLSVTATNMTQEGIIPNTEFTRNSISIGGNSKLENGLNVGGNFSYTKSSQKGVMLGAPMAAAGGQASSFARTLWLNRSWDMSLPYEKKDGSNLFYKNVDNPLWSWKNNNTISDVDRLVGSFNASYKLTDWLNAKISYGINTYNDRRQQIVNKGSVGYAGVGHIIDREIWLQEQEGSFTLTASKKLDMGLSIRAVGGYNVNQREYDTHQISGNEMIIDNLFYVGNTITQIGSESYYKRRLYGFFTDIQLGYNDYLFLNLTGRRDYSSTLPEKNQAYNYPAATLTFIFSDMLKLDKKLISLGKLNIAYGKVSNDAGVYSLEETYDLNLFGDGISGSLHEVGLPFNGLPGLTLSNLKPDPNLGPEFTKEFEIGTQLEFLNSRIGFDFTYYKRNTDDQIVSIPIPDATGYSRLYTNAGELENRGVEIGLNLNPVNLANGFRWDITGTFTKNKSEVISLPKGTDQINVSYTFGGSISPILKVGEPYGILYGKKYKRDNDGNILVDPKDGTYIADNTLAKVGDPNPDFQAGIINNFSYKGISLGVVLDYTQGGDLYSYTIQRLLGRGVTKDTEDREKIYILPGVYGDPGTLKPYYDENGKTIPNRTAITTNTVYFQVLGYGAEEYSVYDATTIRLREISLSYQIPKKLLANLPIGSAMVSFSGRNLWHYCPNMPEHVNIDPELSQFGSENARGFDYGLPPSVRRWGFNLKLTF